MSYDLFLDRTEGLTKEAFVEYFSGQPHFKVNEAQAFYEDEDTGVYFSFDYNPNHREEGHEENPYCVAFNLNFYRPSVFALEAEPVVARFIQTLGLSISDPQNDGMGNGPYAPEGFIRGWNHGNAFAYRAILRSENRPQVVHTKPTREIRAVWEWNLKKSLLQERLGEGIFVPKVFWVEYENEVHSASVWSDGIPTLVPETDIYFIPRKELAPLRWFKRDESTCIISKRELCSRGLVEFTNHDLAMRCFKFEEQPPSSKMQRFIKSLRNSIVGQKALSLDAVLDRELVESAKV